MKNKLKFRGRPTRDTLAEIVAWLDPDDGPDSTRKTVEWLQRIIAIAGLTPGKDGRFSRREVVLAIAAFGEEAESEMQEAPPHPLKTYLELIAVHLSGILTFIFPRRAAR